MKRLLKQGADPNKANDADATALMWAASDLEKTRLLLNHGADPNARSSDLRTPLMIAARRHGGVDTVRLLLEHGANPNPNRNPTGESSPLLEAATAGDAAIMSLLLDRGADLNAINRHKHAGDSGLRPLDIARRHGDTSIVELLSRSGAKETAPVMRRSEPRSGNSIPRAVQGSLPLIQRASANFSAKSGCISCHNDDVVQMAVSMARKNGFRVDERMAAGQVKADVAFLEKTRDRLHQGFLFPVGDTFGSDILAFLLIGLDGEHYKADLNTDAAAMFIRMQQRPDGHWVEGQIDIRPPIGSDYVGQTALSMHALQLYAPRTDKTGYEKSVRLAGAWLAEVQPSTHEDQCWKLLGLAWAGADRQAIRKSTQALLAAQRPDGGWADLPSMERTAYATGRALFALATAGLPVSDAAYKRGVQFLLTTQEEDGSWYVRTRALAFQPYFDAGFPYGYDQWISTAATGWAAMALMLAEPAPEAPTARLAQ